MAKRKEFYLNLHIGDYYADPGVAQLTSASRDIWHEAFLRMHQDDRRGVLRGTIERLASVCRVKPDTRMGAEGSPEAQVRAAIAELIATETADVSRDQNGVVTLINRRMSREFKERKSATKRKKRERERKRGGDVTGGVTGKSRLLPIPSSLNPSSSPPDSAPPGAGGREGSKLSPKAAAAVRRMEESANGNR
jgi:hypothetical protein